MRKPDEIIGHPPYMLRWFLFRPSTKRRIVEIGQDEKGEDTLRFRTVEKERTYLPSIYLHEFKRSDNDRHFHDHVGWSVSIILPGWLLRLFGIKGGGGGYWELVPEITENGRRRHPALVAKVDRIWRWRGPGYISFRKADQPHIIALGRTVMRNPDGRIVDSVATNHSHHGKRIFTLWIRGPWRREWGFYTENGWVPWHAYDALGASEGYKSKEQNGRF